MSQRRWTTPPELWQKLRPLVVGMRKDPTKAEDLLWSLLRGKQLGVKFRRQHPMCGLVLDFYAPRVRLAIELDGRGHAEMQQVQRDRERDAVLQAQGIRVMRFWNSELLENPEGVLEAIWRAVQTPP